MYELSIIINGKTYVVSYDGTFYSPQGLLIALNNLNFGTFFIANSGGNIYLLTVDDVNNYGKLITSPNASTTTTTTSTTSTTTTLPPTTTTTTTSTTSTTTTAAPTTTSTTTSTTTIVGTLVSLTNSCSGVTFTNYYVASLPIGNGTILYTDIALTTLAGNGTYSDLVNSYDIVGGNGTLTNQTLCPGATTTTSTTTTSTTLAPTTTTTTLAPTTSTTTTTTTLAPTTTTTTLAPTTSTTTTTTTLALNVYLCVNNGIIFPYPVTAGNGSASGTLYNNSGSTIYVYGVFNSGGNSSGSIGADSGLVNGSNLTFSGTITSSGQTFYSNTYVALNDGDFVTWSLSKQDTLSSGATLRLGYATSIGGGVTNIAENCVVPPTTSTTTTTTTSALPILWSWYYNNTVEAPPYGGGYFNIYVNSVLIVSQTDLSGTTQLYSGSLNINPGDSIQVDVYAYPNNSYGTETVLAIEDPSGTTIYSNTDTQPSPGSPSSQSYVFVATGPTIVINAQSNSY